MNKKYKITIEIEVKGDITAKKMKEECDNLSYEFSNSKNVEVEMVKVDWDKIYYIESEKGNYVMSGKNKKEVSDRFKKLFEKVKFNLVDNLPTKSETNKTGGKNATLQHSFNR